MSDAAPNLTRKRQAKMTQLVSVLVVVVLIAGAAFVWAKYVRTYHFVTVKQGVLYRDGNRGTSEFATAIRKSGAKTVVTLIDDRELIDPAQPQFQQEEKLLSNMGVKQMRVPVSCGGYPNSEEVQKFLAIVNDPANQPVLVHCAQGVRRTGMMSAAFQESVMNMDNAGAKNAIQAFGHSERSIKDVKLFIDNYDPKTMTVNSAALPMSEE